MSEYRLNDQQKLYVEKNLDQSSGQVASHLKVPRKWVLAHRRSLGVFDACTIPNLAANTLSDMKDRFIHTAESPKNIAEAYGIDEASVARWLSNFASTKVAEFKIQVCGDRIAQMTITEISQMCLIPYVTIHRLLEKMELTPARKRIEIVGDGLISLKTAPVGSHDFSFPNRNLGISLSKYHRLKERGKVASDEFGNEYIVGQKAIKRAIENPVDYMCERVVDIQDHLEQIKVDMRALELTKNALDLEIQALKTVLKNMGVVVRVQR